MKMVTWATPYRCAIIPYLLLGLLPSAAVGKPPEGLPGLCPGFVPHQCKVNGKPGVTICINQHVTCATASSPPSGTSPGSAPPAASTSPGSAPPAAAVGTPPGGLPNLCPGFVPGPCKVNGKPGVTICVNKHVTCATAVSPPYPGSAPMDLVSHELDANGLPHNPQWNWVSQHGSVPDPLVACPPGNQAALLSVWCSTQSPTLDMITDAGIINYAEAGAGAVAGAAVGSGIGGAVFGPIGSFVGGVLGGAAGASAGGKATTPYLCKSEKSNIDGHLNWFSATYEGIIYFQNHDPPTTGDDDYNWNLAPEAFTTVNINSVPTIFGVGLVQGNGGALHLEHDSDETIDHFDQSWWANFHKAVDQSASAAQNIVNGDFAIITGLVGLDMVHDIQTELHPVYMMAIRTYDSPDQDTWAVFVRNWGNEGECSEHMHKLQLPGNIYRLRIPFFLHPGATNVSVDELNFRTGTDAPVRIYDPSIIDDGGTKFLEIAFQLPPPENRGFADGELGLRWVGTGSAARTLSAQLKKAPFRPSSGSRPTRERDEPEDKLRRAFESLTPQQKNAYRQIISSGQPSPSIRPVTTVSAAMLHRSAPTQSGAKPVDTQVPDSKEKIRYTRQVLALCRAIGVPSSTRLGDSQLSCMAAGPTIPR
jgi:hypothetical protein